MNEKNEESRDRPDIRQAEPDHERGVRVHWYKGAQTTIILLIFAVAMIGFGFVIGQSGNKNVGIVEIAPDSLGIPEGWVDVQELICIHHQDSTYVVGAIDSMGKRMIDGIAVLSFVMMNAEDEGIQEAITLLKPLFGLQTIQVKVREGPQDAP